jgi:hypothetical protein
VTGRLKAGIVEKEEMAIARQRRGKQFCAGTNKHATVEELVEAVFSIRSAPKLQPRPWPHKQEFILYSKVRA